LDQLLPGGGGGMPSPLVLLVASFVETGLVFPHQFRYIRNKATLHNIMQQDTVQVPFFFSFFHSGYAGAVRPEFFWYDKAAQAR
jgi:hypothetical protein